MADTLLRCSVHGGFRPIADARDISKGTAAFHIDVLRLMVGAND